MARTKYTFNTAMQVQRRIEAHDSMRRLLNQLAEKMNYEDHLDLLRWLKLEVEIRIEAIGEEE